MVFGNISNEKNKIIIKTMEAHTNAQYIYHSNNLNFRGLEKLSNYRNLTS